MPKIIAWQCSETGTLFADKTDYQKHLRKLAAEKRLRRRFENLRNSMTQSFAEMRATCNSFEEVAVWVMAHSELFALNEYLRWKDRMPNVFDLQKMKKSTFTDVEFRNMHYSDNVSNTHAAPFGKPTNWRGEDHLPRGYPGWRGRISFKINDDFEYNFCNSGINTGSGGGGR